MVAIESEPADLSEWMQERRMAMLSGVQSRFGWAREGRRGCVVMERIRRVIKAGEEVVESLSKKKHIK